MKLQTLLFSLFVIISQNGQSQVFDFNKSLDCNWVDPIQSAFLANHLTYKNKDTALEARVIEQYIKRQDAAKIYLLQEDIDKIKSSMKNLFTALDKKDCKFINEVQNLVILRMTERTDFVRKFLGKDFVFNKETEFIYDPNQKSFPKTNKEAEEFISKYIQFQVANYIATDIKIDEAKARVIKNYDRNLKRIKDTKFDDLVSNYLNSFAGALDPHSTFFSRDFYEDFNIDMKLKLEGYKAMQPQATYAKLTANQVFDPKSVNAGVASPLFDAAGNAFAAAMNNEVDAKTAVDEMKASLDAL